MDRRRGVPATQDERLRVETITNRVEEPAPVVLGKRHAATSPVGLDEVLGLGVGDDAGAKRSTKSEVDIKSRRQRKQRKSTHAVRKEEKERLVKEMEELNAQLVSLKQQAMAAMGKMDRDTTRSIHVGRGLRDDVQVNQQKFGELASIMSEFSICNAQAGSPLHDSMLLKRDLESRRTLLRGLKAPKLSKAEHFLQLRRPRNNLRKNIDEGRRFELDNGDFFSERLSNSIHGESDLGVIVMDYVDEDEKYPYQTDRVRKDIVVVMEIRECSGTQDERMVVLTKWVQNKLHRPHFSMGLKEWYELRDRMDLFGKTMQRTLSEDLHFDRGVPRE
ncbi:hypothetical protein PRIC1_005467 [Phytophthora ramorum]